MADVFSKAKRSEVMARIKGSNTKPEIAVRSILHRLGFRFRLHSKVLIGRPDIVLPKWKTVVFVHGCFWHQHRNCQFAYTPKTRRSFWVNKFAANLARDEKVKSQLARMGWRVITVWECEVSNRDRVAVALERAIRRPRKRGSISQN
jgi:DNA mismatch endonuclease, patch repair protein